MLASAAAAAAAVHKPSSGGSRGPAGPRDMPSAGSGGGRRRRRGERAAAQPRRAARPLASPGRCGTHTHRHTHTQTHTRRHANAHTHAHTLSRTHSHPRARGPGYAGCQAMGLAGRGRGREGGESGISGLDRCESISGHFPAASPAPLPLCVRGQSLRCRRNNATQLQFRRLSSSGVWAPAGTRVEGGRDSLRNSAGAHREQAACPPWALRAKEDGLGPVHGLDAGSWGGRRPGHAGALRPAGPGAEGAWRPPAESPRTRGDAAHPAGPLRQCAHRSREYALGAGGIKGAMPDALIGSDDPLCWERVQHFARLYWRL